jgi:large subunit ribosomal protein L4
MELTLRTAEGQIQAKGVMVSEAAFGCAFNEPLVHQVVVAYLAGGRSGSRAQKTRAEVRGGGAKPYRQKGTGRARAGSIRSPLWRGGGKIFAAKPTNYRQKVNKKMYSAALRCILSELIRQERLLLVDDFSIAEAKTRALVARLRALGLDDVLIVTEEDSEGLLRAARNLPWVGVCRAAEVNPLSLVAFDTTLITASALSLLEGRLA